jgi:hypothetical protein
MSKQLEALQDGVQDIKDMLVQVQKGDLYAAQRFVVQQEQLVADGTRLGADLSSAIETHLGNVRAVYSAVRDALRQRAADAVRLVDDAGRILDHEGYDEGLERMMSEGRREAVTLLVAIGPNSPPFATAAGRGARARPRPRASPPTDGAGGDI